MSSRINAAEILAQARANQRKLRTCQRHTFPAKGDNYRFGDYLMCLNCGGEMSLLDVGNYIRGYVAHGGPATDILPDWREVI